jgi:uncharacterized protein YbaA (DUF1428 family)
MSYVDGFLLPLPKKNLKSYVAMAKKASRIFREHGALEYRECVLDDARAKGCLPFPKGAKAKPSETVVLAWVLYKSKAHRDSANAKIMKDPRIHALLQGRKMPFEMRKMMYGGFKIAVKA